MWSRTFDSASSAGLAVTGLGSRQREDASGEVTGLCQALHGGAERALDLWLAAPLVGGPSLSVSYTGMVLTFLYLWTPFMILPLQAALERVPATLIEASGDLGAPPAATFRRVILSLAAPGLVAGAIFTFSLTLGDYIVPQIVGPSSLILGQPSMRSRGPRGMCRSPPPSASRRSSS